MKTDLPEIYVSVDIEADGKIPGRSSMLSLGAVAFRLVDSPDGFTSIDATSHNLSLLPEATPDPATMAWWKQPENWPAYEKTRVDAKDPSVAMPEFVAWLKRLEQDQGGKVVFVGYPASYDFLFVYWYLIAFAGESPFSFSAMDTKTYASAVLGTPFRRSTKKNMPKRWFSALPHTHLALDDAREQGELHMRMMVENLRKRKE